MLLVVFPLCLSAQEKVAMVIPGAEFMHRSPKTGTLNLLRFQESADIQFDKLHSESRSWLPPSIKPTDLRPQTHFVDPLGLTLHRYQVEHEGIPVEGSVITIQEKQGQVKAIHGDLFPITSRTTTPSIGEDQGWQQAIQYALQQTQTAPSSFSVSSPEPAPRQTGTLVFAPKQGEFTEGNFRLCWKYDVYLYQPLYRRWVYVDAETGQVIWETNRIHTQDRGGIVQTKYSGQQFMTTAQQPNGHFELSQAKRPIHTYNLSRTEWINNISEFRDLDNYWDNVNAFQDEVAGDVHWGTEKAYDYFEQTHNWRSLDNQGRTMVSKVHYGVNYSNAFWDGNNMAYGDGGSNNFHSPLTSPDIVGHELMHGITEFSAGLIYSGESGAINESFSDIFGTVIEAYVHPSQWNWLLGEQCSVDNAGIRSMADPKIFDDPDTYEGPLWFANNDVHVNSGVQNKWFYLLSDGETGVNANGEAYTVTGIGMEKAAAIAFRNLTVYLTPTSSYAEARFFSIEAAKDLYGLCAPEVQATMDAWYAVGVGPETPGELEPNFYAFSQHHCAVPSTVQFHNQSSQNNHYAWDFGDGQQSTETFPSHTYQEAGTYTVSLTVTDCDGNSKTMTREAYIEIQERVPYTMTDGLVISDCSGCLLDEGGEGNYSALTITQVQIRPPATDQLVLTFPEFDIPEETGSSVIIKDGHDPNSAALLGVFNNRKPPPKYLVSSTGSVFLTLHTQRDPTGPGFEISWNCLSNYKTPVANFGVESQLSCNGEVAFQDLSTGIYNSQTWDFGDGTTSSQSSPTHQYASSGTYTVSLITCFSNLCDTLTWPNYITVDLGSDQCDSIVPPTELHFSVSPNPAQDFFEIAYTFRGTLQVEVEILDALGRTIHHSADFTTDRFNKTIETNTWGPGIYFVRVRSQKQVYIRKLILH